MNSLVALFPGGSMGGGLLLLRISVAVSTLMMIAACPRDAPIAHAAAIIFGIAVSVGLQTRLASALAVVAPLLCMGELALDQIAIHVSSGGALALTGAGAFSLDARLFGRRTVRLPKSDDSIV